MIGQALKAYDDSNPDVGMGPSYGYFVSQAGRQLDLAPTDYDSSGIVTQMLREARR